MPDVGIGRLRSEAGTCRACGGWNRVEATYALCSSCGHGEVVLATEAEHRIQALIDRALRPGSAECGRR